MLELNRKYRRIIKIRIACQQIHTKWAKMFHINLNWLTCPQKKHFKNFNDSLHEQSSQVKSNNIANNIVSNIKPFLNDKIFKVLLHLAKNMTENAV